MDLKYALSNFYGKKIQSVCSKNLYYLIHNSDWS